MDAPEGDPSSHRPAPVQAAAAGRCSLYWREAQLDISFAETPRFEDEYDTGTFERTLQVSAQQHGAHRRLDRWTSTLSFESGKSKGQLNFETVIPWSLASLEETQVQWRSHRKFGPCEGGGQNQEPLLVAEDALRDEHGNLLFLGILSAPLGREGQVVLAPDLTPELSVRWVDIGCPVTQGPTRLPVKPVGLEVTAGGQSWTAVVGARTPIQIGGVPYEVAVSTAAVGAEGACHTAAFMIYRQGLLERRK